MKFNPAASGIEAAIDEATGYNESYIEKFIDWFNLNVWGIKDV